MREKLKWIFMLFGTVFVIVSACLLFGEKKIRSDEDVMEVFEKRLEWIKEASPEFGAMLTPLKKDALDEIGRAHV